MCKMQILEEELNGTAYDPGCWLSQFAKSPRCTYLSCCPILLFLSPRVLKEEAIMIASLDYLIL